MKKARETFMHILFLIAGMYLHFGSCADLCIPFQWRCARHVGDRRIQVLVRHNMETGQ